MHIPRDEQIDEAGAIVVGPGRTARQTIDLEPSPLRNIFELTVPQITIERGSSVASYKKIQASIVVKVGDGDTHSPAFPRQARLRGNVAKVRIRVLMVERNQRVPAFSDAIDSRPIDGHNVQLAVIVAIEQTDATAHGIENVPFLTRGVRNRQTGLARDIVKMRVSSLGKCRNTEEQNGAPPGEPGKTH